MTQVTQTPYIQNLLDRAAGLDTEGGSARLKPILRDLLEALFGIIEKHDVTETELWRAVSYLGESGPEFGLIVPGIGLEHFMDIVLDARDEAAGVSGGTPRTIEGPLFVEGAPRTGADTAMSDSPEEGETLVISGVVRDEAGKPLPGATVDVWHADSRGFYSHFDPTQKLGEFDLRRQLTLGEDGRYTVRTVMPVGYSIPPGGATETLMKALGRHGDRPAHVHFFASVPGYRHLTTQINIADDPKVDDDFAFGTRDGLVPPITRRDGAAHIEFDLVMVPRREGATNDRSERARMIA